jgi:PKHD-type hydroxylase
VFTPDEAASIIAVGQAEERKEASVGGGKADKTIRSSEVNFVGPNDKNIWIFNKLDRAIEWANEHYFGFDLNGYERFQFTEYKAESAGHYNWHMDLQLYNSGAGGVRKLSASVILNEGYEGGAFQVSTGNQERPVNVLASLGDAIVFPSFIQHRVTPVTTGVRYSMVVWVLGPKFN